MTQWTDPKTTGLVQDSHHVNNLKNSHMIVAIDTETADKNQNILDKKKSQLKRICSPASGID